MSQLYEIAPRLARAREERLWEIVPEGGQGIPGTEWAHLEQVQHREDRCHHCGGTVRIMNANQRLTVGLNRGTVMRLGTWKCGDCGVSMSSNYRWF